MEYVSYEKEKDILVTVERAGEIFVLFKEPYSSAYDMRDYFHSLCSHYAKFERIEIFEEIDWSFLGEANVSYSIYFPKGQTLESGDYKKAFTPDLLGQRVCIFEDNPIYYYKTGIVFDSYFSKKDKEYFVKVAFVEGTPLLAKVPLKKIKAV